MKGNAEELPLAARVLYKEESYQKIKRRMSDQVKKLTKERKHITNVVLKDLAAVIRQIVGRYSTEKKTITKKITPQIEQLEIEPDVAAVVASVFDENVADINNVQVAPVAGVNDVNVAPVAGVNDVNVAPVAGVNDVNVAQPADVPVGAMQQPKVDNRAIVIPVATDDDDDDEVPSPPKKGNLRVKWPGRRTKNTPKAFKDKKKLEKK